MKIEMNPESMVATIALSIALGVVFSASPQPPKTDVKVPNNHVVNENTIMAVVCYNPDGTGPMEKCPAKIECHNKPFTNSEDSLIPCPFWPDSQPK